MTQPSTDARAVVRIADALTTQVRRIADALNPPADAAPTAADDARHATIAAALTAEHYRRAAEGIVASPENHCAAMASAVMRVLPAAVRPEPAAGVAAVRATALRDAADQYASLADQNEAYDREQGQLDEAARLTHGIVRDVAVGLRRMADETPPDSEDVTEADVDRMLTDEDALRFRRRESLLVLLTRLQRHRVLTTAEADALRQHVETEIREANTAREVARGNLRHVQVLVPELEQAQDRARKAERAADLLADAHRRAEQAEELLRVAHETSNRSEAAIERVRAVVAGIAHPTSAEVRDYDVGRYEMAAAVVVALDEPAREPGIVVHPEWNRQVSKPSWVDEGPPPAQNHVHDRLAPALDDTEQPTTEA